MDPRDLQLSTSLVLLAIVIEVNGRLRRTVQFGRCRETARTVQRVCVRSDGEVNLLVFTAAHRVHAAVRHGSTLGAYDIKSGHFSLLRQHLVEYVGVLLRYSELWLGASSAGRGGSLVRVHSHALAIA